LCKAFNLPYFFLQDEFDEEDEMNMYRVQGTLREWVTRDEVRRFIAKKFKEFLLTYVNPKNEQGEFEYVRLINEMVLGIIWSIPFQLI
jgi:DNA replication licensing factor MCM2